VTIERRRKFKRRCRKVKKRVAFACKGTAALLGAALMVAVVGGCEHRPTAI
jgi:hypothetical protein